MACYHFVPLWNGHQCGLRSLHLLIPRYGMFQFQVRVMSRFFGQKALRQLNRCQRYPGIQKISQSFGTRARATPVIAAQQGLFHVDLSVPQSDRTVESMNLRSVRPKFDRDKSTVQYSYNKKMLSASAYLYREREKLISQPRTENEVYHAKHTPRLFYLEREEYRFTASCLPRGKVSFDESDSLQEDFLQRIGRDKNTFFPLHFLMEGLDLLCRRVDDWLIDLNNDARFLRFCVLLRAMSRQMSNEELVEVLKFLARAQVRTRSSVLPVLYEECCNRGQELRLGQRLVMLDSWRMIGFPVPHFSDIVFSQCHDEIPAMSTPELIQLIYLTGENRGAPDGVERMLVEALPDHFKSLSLTELGTVCTALFKSFTSPPTTDLMMQISDRVCSSDIQTVHSYFVVGILKHFRRQYHGYQHFFQHVANAVTPLLRLYPLMSCMQILLSYATMHICHAQLCDAIADEVLRKADEWRSKDATKIVWSFGTLQHLPDRPDFLPTMVDKLVGLQGDAEEYPVNLVTSLLSLAYLRLYPWELLDRLFSTEFLEITEDYMNKTGFDLRRDMLLLNRALEIECPDYHGNRLPESFMLKSDIPSAIAPSIAQQLTSRPEVRFITGLVRSALGRRENYKIHPILPHINTLDIEVRLDEHNQPIPFNEHDPASNGAEDDTSSTWMFPNSKSQSSRLPKGKNAVALSSNLILDMTRMGTGAGVVERRGKGAADNGRCAGKGSGSRLGEACGERRDDPLVNVRRILQRPVRASTGHGEKWLAIVVWARNHSHYGGSRLLGQHAMKRRQLELLGYHVVDVPFQEWTRLMKNRDHQENVKYMRRKIFNNRSFSL